MALPFSRLCRLGRGRLKNPPDVLPENAYSPFNLLTQASDEHEFRVCYGFEGPKEGFCLETTGGVWYIYSWVLKDGLC